ncbi:MAG: hypothetical protein AUH19_07675 [Verrucomicrobia bacterium 13_2_20CM_55_10]|nr:MAG: hypothetical protein AUH19_07675 [Verrucomicrobia bacterium 13_2_20CM_55_10]
MLGRVLQKSPEILRFAQNDIDVVREGGSAFANQNTPIKVLRFEGIYAFVTSISHRFLSIFRERVGCSLGGRGASVRYC